jgi:hypothetical protein
MALTPSQAEFEHDDFAQAAHRFVVKRWNTTPSDVYILRSDHGKGVHIISLLRSSTLSSTRVWVLADRQYWTAERVDTLLPRVPHEDNAYVVSEHTPADPIETQTLASFYRTHTLFGLAIVDEITWRDRRNGDGTLFAFRSPALLPSISVPVKSGHPRKLLAKLTRVRCR